LSLVTGAGKAYNILKEGVYSVRSSGPTGCKATGTEAVVFKTVTVFLALAAYCVAGAAEPQRLQTARLPQVRLQTARLTPVPGSTVGADFHPGSIGVVRSPRAPVRFYDTHLMPELSSQFRGMGHVFQNLPETGTELEQFALRDAVTDSARRTLERATTRALKEFALEWTQIERRLLSIPLSKKITSALPASTGGAGDGARPRHHRGDLGLSLGVSSLRPQVGLRYKLGETTTEFEIDGHGSVDLGFSRVSDVYTRIAVQYDAQDAWYGLYYRTRF
jgi:hypothetical protein